MKKRRYKSTNPLSVTLLTERESRAKSVEE
jgi:hypothetical protein